MKLVTKNLRRLSGLFDFLTWISVCWWGQKGAPCTGWMAAITELTFIFALPPDSWQLHSYTWM